MSFAKNQMLTANCETSDGLFSASVKDLSQGGAFIQTKRKLMLEQEIAMTISLPNSEEVLMVTGEVARTASDGYGVEFKIIFNE
ncbi:hypothetical protein D1BOALGB6SA_5372 [Olavius sp. associated proteobacterium Delta 1]|nr:hypothetical protein D1BOALGB6SA_5372 [Olavius sp. associated proteobacterium Delta 1]